jgi:hypothetical protein
MFKQWKPLKRKTDPKPDSTAGRFLDVKEGEDLKARRLRKEKEDPTLGDFEPLPDTSIEDENA